MLVPMCQQGCCEQTSCRRPTGEVLLLLDCLALSSMCCGASRLAGISATARATPGFMLARSRWKGSRGLTSSQDMQITSCVVPCISSTSREPPLWCSLSPDIDQAECMSHQGQLLPGSFITWHRHSYRLDDTAKPVPPAARPASHLSTFWVSSALIQPPRCSRASDSCAALGCTRLNSAKPAKLRAQYRARDSADDMNCAPQEQGHGTAVPAAVYLSLSEARGLCHQKPLRKSGTLLRRARWGSQRLRWASHMAAPAGASWA